MLFGCHSACHCTPLVYPRSAAPRTLPASPEQSPGTLPESFEHVARFRFVDVPLHVFGKKEAIFLELVGRLRDFLHVASVILVALLERFARVADGLALGLRRLEGDVLAIRFTAVVASGCGRPQRPTGRGGNRRFDS